MEGGGAWPYPVQEPWDHHAGPFHHGPHQAFLGPPHNDPPHYGPPHYNTPPQGPPPIHHQGPPPPQARYRYGPNDIPSSAPQHHQHHHQYPNDVLSGFPYQYKESEWEDEEEEEEEEDDPVPPNTLEEVLQELNIHLPRLAVTAPPSVQPLKGGGRCCLPNLGNSCYMSVVLQCLYHTPTFPAALALACESLGEGDKPRSTVAHVLTLLMTKMDDVKLMKRGMMAYFKGVCGLRGEAFAGTEQQEAHDFLSGLLTWLHQDLAAREEVDCACTKHYLARQAITTTTTTPTSKQSPPHATTHHHTPPGSSSSTHPPNYTIYTGNDHNYNHHHQESPHDFHPHKNPHDLHHHQYLLNDHTRQPYPEEQLVSEDVNASARSSAAPARREGKPCLRCGVTYQRRSMVSELFEGIHQLDIICARLGIILHTKYERFTSLSLPLNALSELTLEEALQQYYGMNMVTWECEYCSKSHLCHQQIRVLCPPRVLAIHLDRATKRRDARKQTVNFPTEHLSLVDYMILSRKDRFHGHNNRYSLYAMCNHRGTASQGHYSAVCRANKSQTQEGHWFLFGDEDVVRTTQVRNDKEAEILFYTSQGVEATREMKTWMK